MSIKNINSINNKNINNNCDGNNDIKITLKPINTYIYEI